MSTPFDIFGVIAPTGSRLVAALLLPNGLETDLVNATIITASTATTAATAPTGAEKIYNGMAESPAGSGVFDGLCTVTGAALPDSDDADPPRPYTVEVRLVPSDTDLSDYDTIAAAFEASTTVQYSRGVPETMASGFLVGGEWTNRVDVRFVNGTNAEQITDLNGIIVTVSGGSITLQSGIMGTSALIRQGDSYNTASGNALVWAKSAAAPWPTDLTGWTIEFSATLLEADAGEDSTPATIGPITGAVVTATGASQSVQVDLTATNTTVPAGRWVYDVQAKSGINRNTLVGGMLRVLPQFTTT